MLDDDGDMLNRIREALEARFDVEIAEQTTADKMGGHASLRVYWRLHLPADAPSLNHAPDADETTLIAMVLASPESAFESAEGPEAGEVPEELPFVDVQRYLASLELPVPMVEYVDLEAGVLLLEDLGDTTFEDAYDDIVSSRDVPSTPSPDTDDVRALYHRAIDLLVETQSAFVRSRRRDGADAREQCIGWRRAFDRKTLRWELDHYLAWGVEVRSGEELERYRDDIETHFESLVDELLELPQTVALRDYQSRNLMYHPDGARDSDWVLIDFQDALRGPVVYDLVALLRDSYIILEPELVSDLVDDYVESGRDAGLEWCDDREALHRAFHLQTVQRKLKDAGRFVYIDREKNNPDFLEYYGPSIQYVDTALQALPSWDALRDLLHRVDDSLEA